MREKAIEIIRKPIMAYHPQVGMTMVALDKGVAGDILNQILKEICEEIEKEENPYPDEFVARFTRRYIFEEARQKFLALFK